MAWSTGDEADTSDFASIACVCHLQWTFLSVLLVHMSYKNATVELMGGDVTVWKTTASKPFKLGLPDLVLIELGQTIPVFLSKQ